MYKWKQTTPTTHVLYDEVDGKIYGKVMSTLSHASHTAFWQNMSIGEYITFEQAQAAVEDPSNRDKLQKLMDSISSSVKP
jgi:hypothetical protein